MKTLFIILISFISFSFTIEHDNVFAKGELISCQHKLQGVSTDMAGTIKIVNNSTLRRLPKVVDDLSIALEKAEFGIEDLGENGLVIYLNDMHDRRYDVSAFVMTNMEDTGYHVKINMFNRQASDKALAATLIHEIMHCVLLDIYKRAIERDSKAMAIIKGFDEILNTEFPGPHHNFFYLMNSGEDGQHELLYHLFYPEMVSILTRFAKIHRVPFFDYMEPKVLMWSGLQKTGVYEGLPYDERKDIETAILREKGLTVMAGD